MLKIISNSDLYVAAALRSTFENLREEMLRDIQPMNAPQAEYANAAIRAAWTIRRCDIAERDLAVELGCDPLLCLDRRLPHIQRTRAQAQREYRAALHELKRLQTDFAIRRLRENAGLQALPVPVDTTVYLRAARSAAGLGPRDRITFPPAQEALDQLAREQGLGASAWHVWYRQNVGGEESAGARVT